METSPAWGYGSGELKRLVGAVGMSAILYLYAGWSGHVSMPGDTVGTQTMGAFFLSLGKFRCCT